MTGIPLLTGFISKYLFATSAATGGDLKMLVAWVALAVSTILNAMYFMRAVLRIYHVDEQDAAYALTPEGYVLSRQEAFGMVALAALTIVLGIVSTPVIQVIGSGLGLLG